MTDAELDRLKAWAMATDPDTKGSHIYDCLCPFCRYPERHTTALALIEEVQRLRTIVAALVTESEPEASSV